MEKNIFKSASNVNLDKILGYKTHGKQISYLDELRLDTSANTTEENLKLYHLLTNIIKNLIISIIFIAHF